MMGVVQVIQLVLMLLEGAATAFNKPGFTQELAGVQSAITSLQSVQGTLVTKVEIDSLKITPQW